MDIIHSLIFTLKECFRDSAVSFVRAKTSPVWLNILVRQVTDHVMCDIVDKVALGRDVSDYLGFLLPILIAPAAAHLYPTPCCPDTAIVVK